MKINYKTLYKIFFYLLITIFIIFIITNTLIEHYDDTNICTNAINNIIVEEEYGIQDNVKPDDSNSDDLPQDNQADHQGTCINQRQNKCDIPHDTLPHDQSNAQLNEEPKPDITVYNTNLYS